MHQNDIKIQNKNKILYLLYKNKKASKKELSQMLELSPGVLTKLSTELINEKKIVELEKKEENRRGPKEVFLGINKEYKDIVGVVINQLTTDVVYMDSMLNIIDQTTFRTDNNPTITLMKIKKELNILVKKCGSGFEELLGIGVTLKGLTNGKESLYGIWNTNVNILEYFQEQFPTNIVIDNGIRANGIYEKIFNLNESFLFIKYFDKGIGGTLIKENEVLCGDNDSMLDFGHMIIDPELDECPVCKRKGCLESLISIDKIVENVEKELNVKLKFEEVLDILDDGNEKVEKIFKKVAKLLALSFINMEILIDINKVKICGKIFKSEKFINYFKYYLNDFLGGTKYKDIYFCSEEQNIIPSGALIINKYMFY